MLWKKNKKDNQKLDMQKENIYLIGQIGEMDWKTLKLSDAFLSAFFEISVNSSTLKPILDRMISSGINIKDAKQTLATRKSLRERIVGDADVEAIKEKFRLSVDELNELKIDIDYYKNKFKKTKKRPYSEDVFNEKIERQKVLEDFVLDNNWIADRN